MLVVHCDQNYLYSNYEVLSSQEKRENKNVIHIFQL